MGLSIIQIFLIICYFHNKIFNERKHIFFLFICSVSPRPRSISKHVFIFVEAIFSPVIFYLFPCFANWSFVHRVKEANSVAMSIKNNTNVTTVTNKNDRGHKTINLIKLQKLGHVMSQLDNFLSNNVSNKSEYRN